MRFVVLKTEPDRFREVCSIYCYTFKNKGFTTLGGGLLQCLAILSITEFLLRKLKTSHHSLREYEEQMFIVLPINNLFKNLNAIFFFLSRLNKYLSSSIQLFHAMHLTTLFSILKLFVIFLY